MSYSKNAPVETIYKDDFELEKFADSIVKGWGCSIPKGKEVVRADFGEWLNRFVLLLNSSADDYFRRVEIIKKNLEVIKNARV